MIESGHVSLMSQVTIQFSFLLITLVNPILIVSSSTFFLRLILSILFCCSPSPILSYQIFFFLEIGVLHSITRVRKLSLKYWKRVHLTSFMTESLNRSICHLQYYWTTPCNSSLLVFHRVFNNWTFLLYRIHTVPWNLCITQTRLHPEPTKGPEEGHSSSDSFFNQKWRLTRSLPYNEWWDWPFGRTVWQWDHQEDSQKKNWWGNIRRKEWCHFNRSGRVRDGDNIVAFGLQWYLGHPEKEVRGMNGVLINPYILSYVSAIHLFPVAHTFPNFIDLQPQEEGNQKISVKVPQRPVHTAHNIQLYVRILCETWPQSPNLLKQR